MSVRVERRKLVTQGGMRHEHPVDGSLVADLEKVVSTNGTTAVNVFGSKGAPCKLTITGAILTALDTTAGNITLKVNSSTVVTIAKGTTAGALVGGTTLSNTSVNTGDSVTVVSSSAGNARMRITYTVD